MEHVFTTDLLNQILFAEQCFRTELISLIDRIIDDRTVRSPAPSEQLPSQDPFLFTITASFDPCFPLFAAIFRLILQYDSR